MWGNTLGVRWQVFKYFRLKLTICAKLDLQPRGSAGEHSAAVGGKWDISNKQRIGFSEARLVQKMVDGVSKLIECEEKLAAGGELVEGTDY